MSFLDDCSVGRSQEHNPEKFFKVSSSESWTCHFSTRRIFLGFRILELLKNIQRLLCNRYCRFYHFRLKKQNECCKKFETHRLYLQGIRTFIRNSRLWNSYNNLFEVAIWNILDIIQTIADNMKCIRNIDLRSDGKCNKHDYFTMYKSHIALKCNQYTHSFYNTWLSCLKWS